MEECIFSKDAGIKTLVFKKGDFVTVVHQKLHNFAWCFCNFSGSLSCFAIFKTSGLFVAKMKTTGNLKEIAKNYKLSWWACCSFMLKFE